MVDSLRYLQSVGEQVRHAFVGNKTILSFQEYMEGFFEKPRVHARDAAQYIRDCFDFYGTTTAHNPGGAMRRFKLFDRPFDQGPGSLQEGEGGAPVCGHEEVQNAIYRILNGFVRAGRINKLILLHGPNGSAKSSIAKIDGMMKSPPLYGMSLTCASFSTMAAQQFVVPRSIPMILLIGEVE